IIVGKSDCRESASGKNRNPDKAVRQIGPKQCRHNDGDNDEQAAHGRRSRFFLVCFGALFANVLADLKFAQAINDQRADNEPGEKSGEAGEGRAEREIAENAEGRKIMEKFQVQQPVEQSASVLRSFSSFFEFRGPSRQGAPSTSPALSQALLRATPSAAPHRPRGFRGLAIRRLPAV